MTKEQRERLERFAHYLGDMTEGHDLRALLAAYDEAQRDAERYRWAREVLNGDDSGTADAKTMMIASGLLAGKDIDAAIDAAIAATNAQAGGEG